MYIYIKKTVNVCCNICYFISELTLPNGKYYIGMLLMLRFCDYPNCWFYILQSCLVTAT